MADNACSGTKKNTSLKVVFILYIISTAAFLVLLYESVSIPGAPLSFSLGKADFYANCLRIIADIMILAGFWKKRCKALLAAGFILNIIPQVFDILLQFSQLSENMTVLLSLAATVFLIIFYIVMTVITVSGTAIRSAGLFAKASVIICVVFWIVSDIMNVAAQGIESWYTVLFLSIDLIQIVTLALWGVSLAGLLRHKKTAENDDSAVS
jgi:hypothetical protein